MTPFCSSWLQAAWTGLIEDHDFICLCLHIFNGLHPLRKHPPVTGLFPWEQSSFFRLCDGTSQEYSRRPDESNFCWVKDCGSAPAPIYTNVQGLVQRCSKDKKTDRNPCRSLPLSAARRKRRSKSNNSLRAQSLGNWKQWTSTIFVQTTRFE